MFVSLRARPPRPLLVFIYSPKREYRSVYVLKEKGEERKGKERKRRGWIGV
jgi:hypothetical protein